MMIRSEFDSSMYPTAIRFPGDVVPKMIGLPVDSEEVGVRAIAGVVEQRFLDFLRRDCSRPDDVLSSAERVILGIPHNQVDE
jgi:hypothetical protein